MGNPILYVQRSFIVYNEIEPRGKVEGGERRKMANADSDTSLLPLFPLSSPLFPPLCLIAPPTSPVFKMQVLLLFRHGEA